MISFSTEQRRRSTTGKHQLQHRREDNEHFGTAELVATQNRT
jgi:hypothetical protein